MSYNREYRKFGRSGDFARLKYHDRRKMARWQRWFNNKYSNKKGK